MEKFIDDFEVELGRIPKDTLAKLLKRSNHEPKRFEDLFVKEAIFGWKGLTVGLMLKLISNLTSLQPREKTIPFSQKNAKCLIAWSIPFCKWVWENVTGFSVTDEQIKNVYQRAAEEMKHGRID